MSSASAPTPAMNRAYWETVAADYEGAVLSVFEHDHAGLVRARIAAGAAAYLEGSAADLGCGVGKFTPLLAAGFSRVEACDLSDRGVAEAKERCRAWSHVGVRQLDLACDAVPFAPVDFVLCVNVLLMPSLDERLRAWRTVTNQVAHGGTLLLVVPSLESVQLEHYREVEARLLDGDSCAEALERTFQDASAADDLRQGVHRLDGLRTKHYLGEELETMLADHQLDVEEVTKLPYRSTSSGELLASWDWLAVAKRR